MYKVLEAFKDPEHGCVYHRGDNYPGKGKTSSPDRVAYLSGTENKFGRPLIELSEPAAPAPAAQPKAKLDLPPKKDK